MPDTTTTHCHYLPTAERITKKLSSVCIVTVLTCFLSTQVCKMDVRMLHYGIILNCQEIKICGVCIISANCIVGKEDNASPVIIPSSD